MIPPMFVRNSVNQDSGLSRCGDTPLSCIGCVCVSDYSATTSKGISTATSLWNLTIAT